MTDLGHPDMIASTFTAVMAPAGTPKEIVAKMNAGMAAVVGEETVRRRIEAIGAEVRMMSPQQSTDFLVRESAIWVPMVRDIAAQQ